MASDNMDLKPVGVHLVGSIPLPDAETAFKTTTATLPGRLLRVPDGEPAHRNNFVYFQRDVFQAIPQVLRQYDAKFQSTETPAPTAGELSSVIEHLKSNAVQTGYDEYALESYKTFASLRSAGVIPEHTRFQVCLPSPLNSLCLIAEGYQSTIEPFYEEALVRVVKNLESLIPHEDLSIQWDVAAEFAMLEGEHKPHFKPFFEQVKAGVIERTVRLADYVSPTVECGYHLCYGDMAHKHYIEPKDMGYLAEAAAAVIKGAKRDITFFHMPVPIDRTDEAFFAPLKDLELGKTQLYLGLVHADDLEGTKQRIAAANSAGKTFGVATECGMGRTPPEHLDSIWEISAAVSEPYQKMI